MSADNGVYIIRFKKEEKITYRVIYAQAIENLDYFNNENLYKATIVQYCHLAEEWNDRILAILYAHNLAETYRPILEYGVSEIHLDIPYPEMSIEEANRIMSEYWKERNGIMSEYWKERR